MDSVWQSVSKITLDLPWLPARAGRQEEREGKVGVRNREVGGVEGGDQARPATMTSPAFKKE